jgi:type VI secretion system Hcp family effector
MANDNYVKIEKCPGESTDKDHKDEIEFASLSHQVSQDVSDSFSSAGGAGRGGGRSQHGEFTFIAPLDKAYPKLFQHACNGQPVGKVEISFNRPGGDKVEFLNTTLENCFVSHCSLDASEGSHPTMSFGIAYGVMETKYTAQKLADGTGGGNVAAKHDRTKNETT